MVVAWMLLFFCFLEFPFVFASTETSPPIWWTIEISASVSGSYQAEQDSVGLKGRYQFLLRCLGSMERDNGDYILYQGEKYIDNLNWYEDRGGESLDLSRLMDLGFKLHYVIRNEKGIYLDFEVFSLQAGGNYLPIRVFLPCSDENGRINLRNQYNEHLAGGSNIIGIIEDRLYRENQISEVFHWQWEKNEKSNRQSHSVELKLKIHQMQK